MEQDIRSILSEVLELTQNKSETITKEESLIKYGLDSLKAVDLVVNLENLYDIILNDEDLLLDNINSIDNIMDTVKKYMN